jgi:3-mercaptopyruvate sulfurtransferase SseA
MTVKGKPKYPEEYQSQCHFAHHKSHIFYCGIGEMAMTNLLFYGMTCMLCVHVHEHMMAIFGHNVTNI